MSNVFPLVVPEASDGIVAAIDLGSNSFHMIVGRLENGQLHIVDRVRERVRLGAGLDRKRNITPAAKARALLCLARFEERLRAMGSSRVRTVGTNTLRQAKNGQEFIREAEEVLGHPIEVIAGREEARLIYLGMLQTMSQINGHRLVMDIGGGSTEFIIGKGPEIVRADSLFMGCVSFSKKFFAEGKLSAKRFARAKVAAGVELQSSVKRYKALGWDDAQGSSGTIHAIRKIGQANGWCEEHIRPKTLQKIERALVAAGSLEQVTLDGLAEHRRPVIAGGIAILAATFERLGIESMLPSAGALREGALYDLVGRIQHVDVRDRTIQWFSRHYAIDESQAARIETTAHRLLEQCADAWGLNTERARQLLSWAAKLHEIGLAIAHTGYHKHAAYIVANADMAGFSRNDQRELAGILRAMRRSMKASYFEELPGSRRRSVLRIAVLFRLARALNRSRRDESLPDIRLRVKAKGKKDKLKLVFPAGWLDAHPLTRGDMKNHADSLKRVGVSMRVRTAIAVSSM